MSSLPIEAQWFLLAALDSYVANYLIRPQVGTHVTVAIVERLPVPKPPSNAPVFRRLAALARLVSRRTDDDNREARAELQALMARLYGLEADDFTRVLETLPLVPRRDRDDAIAAFHASVENNRW